MRVKLTAAPDLLPGPYEISVSAPGVESSRLKIYVTTSRS